MIIAVTTKSRTQMKIPMKEKMKKRKRDETPIRHKKPPQPGSLACGAAEALGEKKAARAVNGLKSQRKRRLTPSRHRRHDRLLAKCGLVITGQFFGSFGH